MEDAASAVATEVTKGIFGRVPDDAIPYIFMVIIVTLIFALAIFVVYKLSSKIFDKAIEEVRKGYDNTIKSQQETSAFLTKKSDNMKGGRNK